MPRCPWEVTLRGSPGMRLMCDALSFVTVEVSVPDITYQGVHDHGRHPTPVRTARPDPIFRAADPRRCLRRTWAATGHRALDGQAPLPASPPGHPGQPDPALSDPLDPDADRGGSGLPGPERRTRAAQLTAYQPMPRCGPPIVRSGRRLCVAANRADLPRP